MKTQEVFVQAPESALTVWLEVAVDVPLAALPPNMAMSQGVDYVWRGTALEPTPVRGNIVLISWARRRCLGVVLDVLAAPRYDAAKVMPATLLPALKNWALPVSVLKLAAFAAQYYHRGIGEVLLPTVSAALPAPLRPRALNEAPHTSALTPRDLLKLAPPTAEQTLVLAALSQATAFGVHVLYGVTGSGKTEVYLTRAAQAIAADKQVLLLVPEIVLVPAMLARVKAALPQARVAALHSDIALPQRRKAWAACLAGQVDVVVGTRLAVFAPLPEVGLVVVDEEHDPSYKQQEGVRYCARNLAIVRARLERCPVVLGSATPSLETWHQAQLGKYQLHRMTQRARAEAVLPALRGIDLTEHPAPDGLSEPAVTALADTLARGEQSLVFLNRRGFAPVLACAACGWVSECSHCSSHMALHKMRQHWRLVCHHCAAQSAPPKACPECGSVQLEPEGQGTQQIETALHARLPDARIARLDSDVTRQAGQGKIIAQAMADRHLDVLVGTQMTAKGHDFPALSTVLVVGCDGALFSPDFRGVERLYALLTQVSGRAGRAGLPGTVWLQTRQPQHPVFAALLHPSVDMFYAALLAEREEAGLPPYGYQAVLRANHPDMDDALQWLAARKQALPRADHPQVRVYAPVPMLMPKLANKHRAQLLFESHSRSALHALLHEVVKQWVLVSKTTKAAQAGYGVNWWLELDPNDV